MLPEFSHAPATQQPQELLHIQQPIPVSQPHQLTVARPIPLARMPHDPAPHHVQFHIDDTFPEILARTGHGGMVATLPERARAPLAPVVVPGQIARRLLHQGGNGIRVLGLGDHRLTLLAA